MAVSNKSKKSKKLSPIGFDAIYLCRRRDGEGHYVYKKKEQTLHIVRTILEFGKDTYASGGKKKKKKVSVNDKLENKWEDLKESLADSKVDSEDN